MAFLELHGIVSEESKGETEILDNLCDMGVRFRHDIFQFVLPRDLKCLSGEISHLCEW